MSIADSYKRIAILHGAYAADAPLDEQDGQLEVEGVEIALRDLGCIVQAVPLTLDVSAAKAALQKFSPDLVFNLVEAVDGLGALIHLGPCLLESMGLPYTGARVSGMALSCDKLAAKRMMRRAGIPTAAWFERAKDAVGLKPGGRYIVKSITEHASIGLCDESIVDGGTLPKALEARGPGWFAEAYIEGREFNVAMLEGPNGPEVLPISEILFLDYPPERPKIVGYSAKWEEGSFEYLHTPRSFPSPEAESELLARLKEIALDCWDLFEQRGYCRVDFRVNMQGEPMVLEVNANPCITPDAGFASTAIRVGMSYQQIVEWIVKAVG